MRLARRDRLRREARVFNPSACVGLADVSAGLVAWIFVLTGPKAGALAGRGFIAGATDAWPMVFKELSVADEAR